MEFSSPAHLMNRIPRPRRALGVMRRMRLGYPILEAGPLAITTYLDGYGAEAALWLGYFRRNGWIAAQDWPNGVRAWFLSDRGLAILALGEDWWQSLTWSQRLVYWLS